MNVWVLNYREFGWEEGDMDTTTVIGVFESEKLAKEAEETLYLERAQEKQKASYHKCINGKYYSLHGDTTIDSCILNEVHVHGI